MKYIKILAGQTIIYGAGTIVPRLLNYLLLTPFYTRIFDTGQYGKITELYAYVAFFLVFLTYGTETTFFRFFKKKERIRNDVYNQLITLLLITTLSFFIIFSVFLPQFNFYYVYSGKIIIIVAGIVVFDVLSSIPYAKLRIQNKALLFSLIKISTVVLNIFLNILFLVIIPWFIKKGYFLFAAEYFTNNNLYYYAFLSNFFASFLSFITVFSATGKFRLYFNVRYIKVLLNYSWPILVIGICGMINEVADKIMLRWLLPDNQNAIQQIGIYGANYKLAVLISIFIQMFRYAADPFFFSHRENVEKMAIFGEILKWFVIFCFSIFLLIMLFIDYAKYFIGSSFHIGLNVVPIVLLANIFLGIYYNISIWFKISSRNSLGAMIAAIGAIITIILNIVLVPIMGYIGAAWATFICYFSMMMLSYFIGNKYFRFHYPIKQILLYILFAITIWIISYYINFGNLFRLLSVIIYLFIVLLLENKLKKLSVLTQWMKL